MPERTMIVNHDDCRKDCFSCANAFVDENKDGKTFLRCSENDYRCVRDDDSCSKWN